MSTKALLAALALAASVSAKTDLSGCTSSETIAFGGASIIFYVPDSGEICSFLDCGGGRAPPKTTVPGCPGYAGTATYTPDFLPGYGPNATPTPESSAAESSAPESSTVQDTASPAVTPMITTAPVAPTISGLGTGAAPTKGGNNATISSGAPEQPEETGAAGLVGVNVLGLMGAVAGLALL